MDAKAAGGKASRQTMWKVMEKFVQAGKARAIGVSHYCQRHLQDVMEIATIPIAVNQVQYHVGMGSPTTSSINATDSKAFCDANGVTYQSFSPLCGPCQDAKATDAGWALIPMTTLEFRLLSNKNMLSIMTSLTFREPSYGECYWRIPSSLNAEDCLKRLNILRNSIEDGMRSSNLKITSASTGSSSSITIKADSGTHAKALFGVGASVTGVALRAGATGTLKTALTGTDMVSVVVECAAGVVFDTLGAVTINSGTPIAATAVTAVTHT